MQLWGEVRDSGRGIDDKDKRHIFYPSYSTKVSETAISEEHPDQQVFKPDSKLTVLVADDEPGINKLTTLILTRAGYEVISVKDGRAVYECIQKSEREIPVLFCSGFSFSVLKENEFREINIPVLAKPFSAKELLAAVERLNAGRVEGP